MGMLGMLSFFLSLLEKADFLQVFGSFDALVLHVGLHNNKRLGIVNVWENILPF